MPINREQLAAEAPDVLAAVQAEAVTAERQRIKDVQAQLIPGHESVIREAIENGASAAEDIRALITRHPESEAVLEAVRADEGEVWLRELGLAPD